MGIASEVVVSRFNEPLDWVLDLNLPTTIYNKGPKVKIDHPLVEVIDLPNWGREAGSILTHIVRHYHDLAEWTFFLQGKPHASLDRLTLDYTDTTPLATEYLPEFPRAEIKRLDRVEMLQGREIHWGLADWHGGRSPIENQAWLASTWRQFFDCDQPEPWTFAYGAELGVARRRIIDRPLEFWRWVLDLVKHGNGQEQTSTSAWGLETVWTYLLGDAAKYPVKAIPRPKTKVEKIRRKPCGCGKDRPKIKH